MASSAVIWAEAPDAAIQIPELTRASRSGWARHYRADGATLISGGKTLVYEAAWARSAGRPVNKLAPMAKLFACQTYRDVTAMCEQVYGGYGFTVDFDIQLYFRRAKQLQLSWWDTRYLEELVAAAALDGKAA